MYSSPSRVKVIKSRRLRWIEHVAQIEDVRIAFKMLTGKKCRLRWDNIIMDLKEIGVSARNWIDSAQDMDYRRGLVNIRL